MGCNRQLLPDGMPKSYPAAITIIQGGQPLSGASVALIPMESSNPWNAGGVTDTSGKAVLKTRSEYNGVVPGKYYVTVVKLESARDGLSLRPGYDVVGYDLVELKFSQRSPDITIEVVAGKKTEKEIDVGEPVHIAREVVRPDDGGFGPPE